MMALAPLLGNWISLHLGWRANFYLIAILATLTFFCNVFFTKETLALNKRTPLNLTSVLKNYGTLLLNFSFMAHTLIWCLMFSVVIVFIANLSLIFVDYLDVPKASFGYYQTAIMGGFFVGSMSAAYFIKKIGMLATKVYGSLLFVGSVLALGLLSFINSESPLLLIITMSLASLGSALSLTIYFSYSMIQVSDNLKGSAMSLTQSLRLSMSSGLVWIAAYWFDGSTKPMSLLAMLCTLLCVGLYILLYRRKMHFVSAT
jgi:DHA1 family bicyclomycin/chloramphenicol resistance-like MFS transporter